MAAASAVDIDSMAPLSNDHNLGWIDSGHFFPSADEQMSAVREGFSRLQRQENQEPKELRIAVLAPDVAVLTALANWTAYFKDGTTFTSDFAHTWVAEKIDGEWKMIHAHQSVPPQTG